MEGGENTSRSLVCSALEGTTVGTFLLLHPLNVPCLKPANVIPARSISQTTIVWRLCARPGAGWR